ncbi:MAG: tetratricopeptide repeat protein [Bacteroidetes bacterium]|nr:tetratricopeptide repeat protein [Bacteroidota bacterium]
MIGRSLIPSGWLVRTVWLLLVPIFVQSGCRGGSRSSAGLSTQDVASPEASRFRNLSPGVAYVGDDACFDCHEDQYQGFKEHGMARSVYPLNPETAVETFGSEVVHDTLTGYFYRPYVSDGKYLLEEFRLDALGNRTHSLVREMQFVVGSGTTARTYLSEQNGWYYELPLTWYTQVRRWDFSPGYRVANKRFDRKISSRCIVCHNSYPEPEPFTDGMYRSMPYGIGCERCHGPGELHVDERLAIAEPAGPIDDTIVNPAHLSLDRRLDVCRQCHLQTTVSVLRAGRTPYDFRPSQVLSDYVAMFSKQEVESDDEIGVISHADRMKRSVCFLATASLGEPMECVTCHDPHEGFRGKGDAYFNRTCMTCHRTAVLQELMSTTELEQQHTAVANCIECHMPKKALIGAPHSAFTDHWIRVVGAEESISPVPVHDEASLVPYFERDMYEDGIVYEGMAYVTYGRRTTDMNAIRTGIELLDQAFDAGHEISEARYLHGYAFHLLGEAENAIPSLEIAVTLEPDNPERLNALAQAYEATGRSAVNIERLYARALSIQPINADIRINYGRFLESRNRLSEAITAYEAAISAEPWNDRAYYNLGTAYIRTARDEEAEQMLKKTIELNPLYAAAWSNLGVMYMAHERVDQAVAAFERALSADPVHADALSNLGLYYMEEGDLERAIPLLTRSVEADPSSSEVLARLALAYFRSEDEENARLFAERALQLDPSHALALQIVDAL